MSKEIRKRKTKVKSIEQPEPAAQHSTVETLDGHPGELGEFKETQPVFDPSQLYEQMFEQWDEHEYEPTEFMIDVPTYSLESCIGYSSLFRQFQGAFARRVAFYRSASGGSLSPEEARKAAFHPCKDREEAKKHFETILRTPFEQLNFIDLEELHQIAPRVAERFWDRAKREAGKEFVTGHLGAHISFPVGYMKQLWNIARYLGVRDSFIDEWNPRGGIEIALIDMMTQSYFQWQYWLEQTVKRSKTKERTERPEYQRWLEFKQAEDKEMGWTDGFWFRPTVTEQQALEHAVQLADRWNRMFTRTLRQLRDLRRYAPVTIHNPNQVNIAGDGGQQVNIAE